jgi:uncharacterized surface protein with fasciclin (FAS1) repeats
MKRIKNMFFVFAMITFFSACKESNTDNSSTAAEVKTAVTTQKTGQAFIEGDVGTTVLSIAMDSKDHTTLVAAVQAAQLENALVNAGPLMVFAPTNEAFAALPEGTVENLLKPENKDALANILKYHVTPGNYSKEFLKKFKKLGQANNGYVKVEVVDGESRIGGAKILGSVKAGNGIVHIIDKVLLPPTE